jgi:hypothetical protein
MKAFRIMAVVLPAVLAARAVAAADSTVAVLGIEAADGAPEAVAVALTDALRQRASGEKGWKLVPGKDLVEVKLIFSCPDEASSCMADAAKSLGAAKVIFGGVKKVTGDSFLVTLKMLDAGRKQVDNFVAEQIPRAQATSAGLRGPVQKWFATLTGQGGLGIVRVKGDVPGTSVSLDGAPVGVIGSDDLVLGSVTAGHHELVASKPGYPPMHKDVNVTAGGTGEVRFQMAATVSATSAPPPPPPPTPVAATVPERELDNPPDLRARPTPSPGRSSGKEGMRAAAFGTLGGSLVSFGLAVYFGMQVRDINSQLDPDRRFQCSSTIPPAQAPFRCDINGNPAPMITQQQRDWDNSQLDQGNRFQTYQYIAIGAGSVLAVASGVLFYFGYLADDAGGGGRDRGYSLRLLPMASPQGGGMLAAFSF